MEHWNVYLVMDLKGYAGRSPLDIAIDASEGGIDVIQIREKHMDDREFYQAAKPIRELCRKKGICFIVNDRVDMAVKLDADGLHVGQDDTPGSEARKKIGSRILGISASSLDEAERALQEGADYLGVGSIYTTQSKPDAGEAVTPSLIRDIRSFTAIPIVGIGGIKQGFAAPVIHAGANAVAVISAICHDDSPKKAAAVLREEVLQAKLQSL